MVEKGIQLNSLWLDMLKDEFNKDYMKHLKSFLLQEKRMGKVIYPPGRDIFNAFNLTPYDQVKIVIIGQDPYHGQGQAHGLCFSVKRGVRVPPSLRNIYEELHQDVAFNIPQHGDLTEWANQGVLLLNATLTVRAREAASHQNKGWELFTNEVIKRLSMNKEGLVFLLWGTSAKTKAAMIDTGKHDILTAAHPSPLSAYQGFFGCKHFSQANEILVNTGRKPINWRISLV